MLNRISLRKKVLIFRLTFLLLFSGLMVPFSNSILARLVYYAMDQSSETLIHNLQEKPDIESMVLYLDYYDTTTFFYTALIDPQLQTIQDSRRVHSMFSADAQEKTDAAETFKTGTLVRLGNTPESWTYIARRFYHQDTPYVLFIAMTTVQIASWISHFKVMLIIVFLSFIFLYSIILWWGGSRLIRPLLDITQAIRPYAMSKTEVLVPIPIQSGMAQEYKHLAVTINSLLEKVKDSSRQLIEEKKEKEAILESLMEGVVTIDAAGIVRSFNHTAAQMLGVPRRQMIGKSFMPQETHPKIELFKKCHAICRLALEQGNVLTDSISFADTTKIYLDLIAVPKPFHTGVILILQDKSSQQKVVEMGKDFIANASHELRTPITIIKGFAETLQDLPSVSVPMLAEITEKIVRNCHRMDTLVKNLLTLSDIEYVPDSRFQARDIVALADNCRHVLLTLSPTIRVDIEKSHDQILMEVDHDLLELALMNLLENGIKYSNAPAHLTIYLKQQSDEVLVAIQDRGIGISSHDLPHVFERFYTVNKAHSRRLGGAGLGLSIVKTIIEKHEGTISVASVLGQGTTFTFVIPQHRRALNTI